MPADSEIAHEYDPIHIGSGANVCNKCGQNELHPSHHGWTRHSIVSKQLDASGAKIREQKDEIAQLHAMRQEKPHLTVITPLTQVMIGPEEARVPAVIESIGIAVNGAVWYDVVWWAGRERREAKVHASEVGIGSPGDLRTVGFHNGTN
jgi:hypothetical protein